LPANNIGLPVHLRAATMQVYARSRGEADYGNVAFLELKPFDDLMMGKIIGHRAWGLQVSATIPSLGFHGKRTLAMAVPAN
jgi:hypothetical protein